MGALISNQAGSVNMAMEGIMLTSALTAVFLSALTHSVWGGLLGAIAGGLIISFILAYMNLVKKSELFLTGIALNMMASGGTIFALYAVTGEKGTSRLLSSLVVPNLNIPVIKDIPIIGEIFSGHNALTYVSFLFAILTYLLVFRTRTGLRIRAVGYNPLAAESVGINVNKIRFQAFLYSGLFASFGGAFMSMGYLSYFAQDMVSGRGFIGISAAMFADSKTLGTLLASVGFGAANALSITLKTLNMKPELVNMVPYLATVIGLVVISANKQMKERKCRKNEQSK
jgi:simple sugar transport system permease protein